MTSPKSIAPTTRPDPARLFVGLLQVASKEAPGGSFYHPDHFGAADGHLIQLIRPLREPQTVGVVQPERGLAFFEAPMVELHTHIKKAAEAVGWRVEVVDELLGPHLYES